MQLMLIRMIIGVWLALAVLFIVRKQGGARRSTIFTYATLIIGVSLSIAIILVSINLHPISGRVIQTVATQQNVEPEYPDCPEYEPEYPEYKLEYQEEQEEPEEPEAVAKISLPPTWLASYISGAEVILTLNEYARTGIRLRSGPGMTEYTVLEILFGNNRLLYLGQYEPCQYNYGDFWLNVLGPSGTIGYISTADIVLP